MKEKLFFLIIIVFSAQLLLGQEKFTIRGEFPDNTLDGKYVLLIDKSYLLEEREGQKQAYDNSIKIKVIGKEFFYEGTVTRKPYFAQISYDGSSFHKETDINLFVEPGNIYIRMVDWDTDANVSGTSINEDYNTYILEREAQWSAVYWNRDRRKVAEDSTKTENSNLLDTSVTEQRSEGRFTFLEKYAKYPNVIYEICNEPNGGASWSGNIKPYAEKIIPVIRKNAPNSVIIVGTPTWSQEIDKPLSDPLSYKNVMYAFHFYAATHAGLRSNVENCVAQGLPVFVSEFGTCDASGGGANDFNETQKWLSYFDKQGISYCNWSICNKDETCSVLRPGTSANGNWSESDLTENGKWMRNWFRKH